MKTKALIATILLAVLMAATSATVAVDIERDALMALYDSTGGDDWDNNSGWGIGDPCDPAWYGVSCESGHVTALDLNLNELSGPIPAELGNLSSLSGLQLQENQLSGSIPTELGMLSNLTWLNLGGNQLSGPIPAWLGDLSSLSGLILSGNRLTGPIPSELGNLSNMVVIILHGNRLSGPIPPELGKLNSMRGLYLGGNQLSGPIPAELGNLSSLGWLDLGGNQLSEPIPAELGNLSLVELFLDNNQLSGPIPAELGNLSNLEVLDLGGNPDLYCWQTEAALNWALGLDSYDGPEPICTPDVSGLMALYSSASGPSWTTNTSWGVGNPCNPGWFGLTCESGRVKGIDLSNNQLTGHVPAELSDLDSLQNLNLGSNAALTCVLTEATLIWAQGIASYSGPETLCTTEFAGLMALYNSTNGPGWEIDAGWGIGDPCDPAWYGVTCQSGHVSELNLWNELRGNIPAELSKVSSLQVLNLADNNLYGSIPPELGNLSELQMLDLNDNQLSGPIPQELGDLSKLKRLDLNDNDLSGPIPAELGKLSDLQMLSLSSNRLSGPIPAELGNLSSLLELYLNDNRALVCWQTQQALVWAQDELDYYYGPNVACRFAHLPLVISGDR